VSLSPPMERSELEEIMRLLLSVCVCVRPSLCLSVSVYFSLCRDMHSNERLLVLKCFNAILSIHNINRHSCLTAVAFRASRVLGVN